MGTGIVDYLTVSHQLSRMIESRGERIILCAKVTSIAETSRVVTVDDELGTESAELLISSAGLYGDIIARNNGLKPSVQIIPFRGEYFELKPDRRYLVNVVV
jgi:L-2-hydroxyglutarate oxidase